MSRRITTLLSTLLIPLFVLLLTPRVRPISAAALVFTYLIPRELEQLAAGLDHFRWQTGVKRHRGATITYLVGEPA